MTEKLSQFTAAVPVPTDYVASATAGSPNKKYLVSDLGGFATATGNVNLYVATTGSDSNPGTLAQPFATIQHGLNVAASFNYQGLYFPTVNVAAGTYTIIAPISLPELTNVSFANFIGGILIGDNGHPQNYVIHDTGNAGICLATGAISLWGFEGFQLDSTNFLFNVSQGAFTQLGNMNFTDSTNAGGLIFCFVTDTGTLALIGGTYNFLNTQWKFLASMTSFTTFSIDDSTVVWAANTVWNSFDTVQVYSSANYIDNVNTNFASMSGGGVSLGNNSTLATTNGIVTEWPTLHSGGFGLTAAPSTSFLALGAATTAFGGELGIAASGLPNNTQLGFSQWFVYKDTSGGGVYLAYNDAGTLKKVALV